MCTATCEAGGSWEAAVYHRELSLVFCGDLEGWDGGGQERGPRGRRYMYIYSGFTSLYSRSSHSIVK